MRRLRSVVPWLVAGVTVLAFLPALEGQFLNWDDNKNLTENPAWRGLGRAELRWMFTATLMGHWIPLTWVSFGVNYVLGGLEPWGYHAGNLLLHAVNAGLFYFVARRLLGAVGAAGPAQAGGERGEVVLGAAVAALVFGVHPLRVESVAWVTERRDVLCGFFVMLAVLAWLKAVEGGGRPRGGWWAASIAAYSAALMSKTAAVPLAPALLLLDAYPLGRLSRLGWRRCLVEKTPHVFLAAAASAVALFAVSRGSTLTSYAEYGPAARLAMVFYSLAFYPWKFLWPEGLSPMYELPARVSLLEGRFLGPAVAVVGGTAVLVVLRRRWPGGLAAWGYSALMLLPVSGVVHAGFQLAHDRYSYLSGLGFALLVGGAAGWVWRAGAPGALRPVMARALLGTLAVVLLILAAGSWRQSKVWHDSETLWRWAAETDPSCMLCLSNLGLALLERRPGEAEVLFRQAVALRPSSPVARANLGTALVRQGRDPEAAVQFGEALRLSRPGSLERLGAAANLGLVHTRQERWAEALPLLREALAGAPGLGPVRESLMAALRGRALELRGEGREAEAAALEREAAQRSTMTARSA
jgi:tetratricopeptide (TPR) repeat protein